jgi:hypothetical protein
MARSLKAVHERRSEVNDLDPRSQPVHAPIYRIRLNGHLGRTWAEWFEGWSIALEDEGDTVLTGPVVDQATLHGLLKRVRDLGMPIVSVVRVEPDRPTPSDADTNVDLDTPQP